MFKALLAGAVVMRAGVAQRELASEPVMTP